MKQATEMKQLQTVFKKGKYFHNFSTTFNNFLQTLFQSDNQ